MKTLKSLILLLVAGIAMVACNSSFEENKYINAPESLPYGIYKLTTSDTDYNYYMVHTKSVNTELDALYVLRETINPADDDFPWRIVIVANKTEGYDATVGTLTCETSYCYYGDGENNTTKLPAAVSLVAGTAYTTGYQYQFYTADNSVSFSGNAELVDLKLPILFDTWGNKLTAREDLPDYKEFYFMPQEIDGIGYVGYMTSFDANGRPVAREYFVQEFDEETATGTLTFYEDDTFATETGAVYTFYFDENNSLVIIDENGDPLGNFDPYPSTSEPEEFEPVAMGNFEFNSWGEGEWEAVLSLSKTVPAHYKLEPFCNTEGYFVSFYVNNDGTLTVERSATPHAHSSYGTYYVATYDWCIANLGWGIAADAQIPSTVNGNVYTFNWLLIVSNGYFGVYPASFTIDPSLHPEASAAQIEPVKVKAQNFQPIKAFDGTLTTVDGFDRK